MRRFIRVRLQRLATWLQGLALAFWTSPAEVRVSKWRAAEIIAGAVAQPHFFLFSDDPAWTGRNLRLRFPASLVESAGDEDAAEHLRLMSLCRHHVIANSSFSWWGAWLNPRPDKRVIAPQRWFNADAKDARDLTPGGWTRI